MNKLMVLLLAFALAVGLTALALALAFGITVPALGNQTTATVDTSVTVQTGGGTIPIVKAKWETPDEDPNTLGTQIFPPCTYQGSKTVTYWAIVTDEEDNGCVNQVYVDIYHPDVAPWCRSFKYEVPMTRVDKFQVGIPEFQAAYLKEIITFNSGFNYEEVLEELNKCTAEVWMGTADLAYHQPAGDYLVQAFAIDKNGNLSDPLVNTFEYVAVNCTEIDFTEIKYGSAGICTEKWIAGDTNFGTADKATVRNIGNTNAYIMLEQDDMGFGQDVTGQWNVQFDARLGNDPINAVYYYPNETVTLPNYLPPCNTEELDFSIHVIKGVSGQSYEGEMVIWSSIAPFEECTT